MLELVLRKRVIDNLDLVSFLIYVRMMPKEIKIINYA